VDAKGRIALPKEVRERLGLDPGTTVVSRADEERAVVEPVRDSYCRLSLREDLHHPRVAKSFTDLQPVVSDDTIRRMEGLIETAATDRSSHSYDDFDAYAQDHADTIQAVSITRELAWL